MEREDQEVKTLEQRVETLEQQVAEIFAYVRDSHNKLVEQIIGVATDAAADCHDLRKLVRAVELLQDDLKRRINEAESLRAGVAQSVNEFRILAGTLKDQIGKGQELAEALDKLLRSPRRLVVTRPASHAEIVRDAAAVIPVRQATSAEIRALAEME